MAHDAGNALVTSEPIRVVGKERAELDSAHRRKTVNQSIAVWTGLMKGIGQDKTLLNMVVTAGSLSEAWKIIWNIVRESSEAAQDKLEKEFKELPDAQDRKRVHRGLCRQSKSFGGKTRTKKRQYDK